MDQFIPSLYMCSSFWLSLFMQFNVLYVVRYLVASFFRTSIIYLFSELFVPFFFLVYILFVSSSDRSLLRQFFMSFLYYYSTLGSSHFSYFFISLFRYLCTASFVRSFFRSFCRSFFLEFTRWFFSVLWMQFVISAFIVCLRYAGSSLCVQLFSYGCCDLFIWFYSFRSICLYCFMYVAFLQLACIAFVLSLCIHVCVDFVRQFFLSSVRSFDIRVRSLLLYICMLSARSFGMSCFFKYCFISFVRYFCQTLVLV